MKLRKAELTRRAWLAGALQRMRQHGQGAKLSHVFDD
jgi:hypothetical protein